MKRIFINGLSSSRGGAKSILDNLLKRLSDKYIFFVLTPSYKEYKKYNNSYINIIDINSIYKKNIIAPIVYKYILPKIIKKYNINVVLNLATLPIALQNKNIKQIYLFDWPYAIYPESEIWDKLNYKNLLIRKLKIYFLKSFLKYPDVVIAQTKTSKRRLHQIYGLNNIQIIPNGVSIQKEYEYKNFNFPQGIKLLYLTVSYPHKNLEVFIPLAKKIKEMKINIKLIVTIPNNDKSAFTFLNAIRQNNLEDIILNIGKVNSEHIKSLYEQCDGLLMPTYLESFSGAYLEAMYYKKPIITSNKDFSKEICKDIAYYIDPDNVDDILGKIIKIVVKKVNPNEIRRKIEEGFNLSTIQYDWDEIINKYNKLINSF